MISSLEQYLDGVPTEGVPVDGVPVNAPRFAPDLRFGAGDGDGAARADGRVRVLLVDDHADMLGLMRMMMERRSYRVATASSGEAALAMACEFGPQVVVSDIAMPGMNGYELMLALRALSGLSPFKSIALSGYDAQDEEPRARAAGYDAQLTKPVDFDRLFRAIDSFALPND